WLQKIFSIVVLASLILLGCVIRFVCFVFLFPSISVPSAFVVNFFRWHMINFVLFSRFVWCLLQCCRQFCFFGFIL
ncbi:hypothetical protein T265_10141, partial [Opisthorchis viverrini]